MNKEITAHSYHQEQRIERILNILYGVDFSSVAKLAEQFHVSEMTIRRDLDRLERDGFIRRTHGGAVLLQRAKYNIDYRIRHQCHSAEKDAIGRLAAGLVRDGQNIFLDAGTTVLAIVKHLHSLKGLKAVTSSLTVQMELLNMPGVEIILVGGKVMALTMSLAGPLARDAIARMRFDWAFLGAAGIDIHAGLTADAVEEISIQQAAVESARQVAVLADHTKFEHNALSVFMPFDKIHYLITDQLSEELRVHFAANHPHLKLLNPSR